MAMGDSRIALINAKSELKQALAHLKRAATYLYPHHEDLCDRVETLVDDTKLMINAIQQQYRQA